MMKAAKLTIAAIAITRNQIGKSLNSIERGIESGFMMPPNAEVSDGGGHKTFKLRMALRPAGIRSTESSASLAVNSAGWPFTGLLYPDDKRSASRHLCVSSF